MFHVDPFSYQQQPTQNILKRFFFFSAVQVNLTIVSGEHE